MLIRYQRPSRRKLHITALVCAFIALSSGLSQSIAQVSTIERESLLALFNSTNGQNWNNNSGWDPDSSSVGSECTWHGVECSDDSVITLELRANNLEGSIPPELSNLVDLELLNLSFNHLTGSIPLTLGELSNLKELDLSSNELTGVIPGEIGDLSIIELHLDDNQLSGAIPTELGEMSNIEFIALDYNQLTGSIPVSLGNLNTPRLDLRLNNNQLTGTIPNQLGNIENLVRLELHSNQLTGPIPTELSHPENLETLRLNDNQLQGLIPPSLLEKQGLIFRYENNPELILGKAPHTVLIGNREWRQVTDTREISWHEMATVCDEYSGMCSGVAGQADLSGWIWATVDEVNSLLNWYLDSESLGPGTDRIEMDKSTWAPAFLIDFMPTRTTDDFVQTFRVRGLTRTTSDTDSTQALEGGVIDARSTPTISFDDSMYTDQVVDKSMADRFLGHWLYRDLIGRPPEKVTLKNDNSPTSAVVSGGVTTDGGTTYVSDVAIGDTIKILVSLKPESIDIGASSEVFAVAEDAHGFLLITPDGLVSWDGQVEDLVPFDVVTLDVENDLNILDPFGEEFTLTSAEIGHYRFFIGYTVAGGIITYNEEAIELKVGEFPEI